MSEKQVQKPSIGRIVIFVPKKGTEEARHAKELPAIVVKVNNDETVNLTVFGNSIDNGFYTSAYSEEKEEGTWSWPVKS